MLKEEEMTELDKSKSPSLFSFDLDWLGQMVASVLWSVSVFVYGINSLGDVLQLCAALAWTVANIAAFINTQSKSHLHLGNQNEINGV